jgi:hypothetical protein
VNLLNRGYNPFDSFPSGNPQFNTETVAVTVFDDPEKETTSGENLATDFAVETETIQF